MVKNKTVLHIFKIMASNVISIFSGIIVGFLLPKILSVENYGLYKTFSLYLTYVGFCSLGIIDGIVLDYGNYDYDKLDKTMFRTFTKWYGIIHSVFFFIIVAIGVFVNDIDYSFIIFMLALNMLANNFTGYFQQISQITQRFNEYSVRKILQSISNILLVVGLYIYTIIDSNSVSYRSYIILIVTINMLLTIWYFYTYREIVFGDKLSLKETKTQIIHLMKIGFPLLFANLCSTLILTLDRQFVNILFDNTTYAIYAFAYNLLSLVTVATSAISMVLYPILKRSSEQKLKTAYKYLIEIILIFVFGALILYFPLVSFIDFYLPKYHESLQIFRIIFPGLAISTCITVIMHNYYKTLGKNNLYFKKSILILALSAVTNYTAYCLFGTPQSISTASIITMVIWYVSSDRYFIQTYQIKAGQNFGYLVLMMVSFYFVSLIDDCLIGCTLYLLCLFVLTVAFYKNTVPQVKELLKD